MTVKKYRNIPVEIEAMQLTRDNMADVAEWCGGKATESLASAPGRGLAEKVYILAQNEMMQADYGDYIIKDTQGEFYPCEPNTFADVFEEVQHDVTT